VLAVTCGRYKQFKTAKKQATSGKLATEGIPDIKFLILFNTQNNLKFSF